MILFCWNKLTRVGALQLDLVWTSSLTRGRWIFSVLDSLSKWGHTFRCSDMDGTSLKRHVSTEENMVLNCHTWNHRDNWRVTSESRKLIFTDAAEKYIFYTSSLIWITETESFKLPTCCFNTYIVYNLHKSSWQTLWLLHCASPSTWLLHVSRSSSPSRGWPSLSPAAAWSTPASWAGTPEPAGTGTGCPGTWPCGTAPRRAASSGSPPLHLSSSSERWRSRRSSPAAGRRHLLRLRVSVAGWSFWAAD